MNLNDIPRSPQFLSTIVYTASLAITETVNPTYLTDASGYTGAADRVWVPADTGELLDVIREAVATGIAVTVAGAGSGLTGARVPLGGWVLSLERFRRLEIG